MGEVYKARDTRLDRTVAIKVLPEHVASDSALKERFEREAKTISSLNHPHICTLHDVGSQDGVDFLVMEHLEGETLQDRLKKGALAFDQALRYAIEIADALNTAHRHGITHRDLKPGNIFLTASGAKLIDFGLAKLRQPRVAGEDSTTRAGSLTTAPGTIMGTVPYMAPEQLEGREADVRSDIWAFGCVLYEMVTGRRAFRGTSRTSVIVAIVEREPTPMPSLEPLTPAGLDYIVTTALAKAPDDRWQTARDLLRELRRLDAGEAVSTASARPSTPRPLALWQRPIPALLTVLAVAAIAGLAVWSVTRPAPQPPAPLGARFSIPLATDEVFTFTGRHIVALSPAGTHVVYTANQGLSLRPVDQLQATPVSGTEAEARSPFFSPDGQQVGFYAAGQLKRVSISGGAPVTLGDAANPWGASWGADNMILYGQGSQGIWRVPGTEGTPEQVIPVEDEEQAHGPQLLPGGEWVLFTLRPAGVALWDQAQIVMQSLETAERIVLIDGGRDARYLPTGHLVYGLDGVLLAVPFDLATRQVTGGAVPLVEGVADAGATTGAVQFSLAATGALAYVPGSGGDGADRSLVWVDSAGREEPVTTPASAFETVHLSADGTRAVLSTSAQGGGNADVWISDLARGTLTRLTTGPGYDGSPLWSPDGQRVAFASNRNGAMEVLWQAADGSGDPETLVTFEPSVTNVVPGDWSPDGSQLLVAIGEGNQPLGIGIVSVGDPASWRYLVQTPAGEHSPTISPDGRWLAYGSRETGSYEVYVQRFPDGGGRQQLSVGGGHTPKWSSDGHSLTYIRSQPSGPSVAVTRVSVTGGAGASEPLTFGNPVDLFPYNYFAQAGGQWLFDMTPDGERFLMNTGPGGVVTGGQQLILVQNWFEELRRLVPVN